MEQKHLFSNKDLLKLLLPLMLEQLLTSLMGMVDTMMVSNVGSAAISAVSLVDAINILIIQALAALAAGGAILCSQYIGSKNIKEAKKSADQLLFIVTTVSLVLTLFCIIACNPLLKLIFGKVEAEVMSGSRIYFLITALSFPFIALYNGGSSIFRSMGNTKLPLIVSVISNIVNVIGNYILIWQFHLDIFGAALATLLSRILLAAVIIVCLRNEKNLISVRSYHKIRPDRRVIRKILHIGIPSGIENSMFQFGKLAIQSTVSTLGTAAIAAQAMTNILENVNGVAAIGVGLGLMTVVGQCIGAGRDDEAIYYVKKLTMIGEVVLLISCLTVFACSKPIVIIAGMEAEAAAMCLQMILAITIVKPIVWIFAFIPGYGLRAAGDVGFSMILSCTSMWFCRVVLCIIFCRFMETGPLGVWYAMFIDWTVRGVAFILRFRSRRWLLHKVI